MKEIKLNRGYVALVDDEDFEYLNQFHWYVTINKNYPDKLYARREVKTELSRKRLLMHIDIMKPPIGKVIDHIDHNSLNNQKHNLRICDQINNCWNRKITKGRKYKGVSKLKIGYSAIISYNKKDIRIGTFDDEIYAAKCYDHYARKLYGEFAYLNFPDDDSTIDMKIKKRINIVSQETRLKMSKSRKGKKYSEETKRKISEKTKQRYAGMTKEERSQYAKHMIGNKNCLGRKLSDETKRKISEAHIRFHQKKQNYERPDVL